jgi:hypothetical protein
MKTAIIAVSAIALIATAPAVFAQDDSSKTPAHQTHMKSSKKVHHRASHHAPRSAMQARSSRTGQPGAFGSAPGQTTGFGSAPGQTTGFGFQPGQTTGSSTRPRY